MEIEKQQFHDERNERQRLLLERQQQEIETFDEESTRLGLNAMAVAEASRESIGDDNSVSGSMLNLSLGHSNSFTHAALQ